MATSSAKVIRALQRAKGVTGTATAKAWIVASRPALPANGPPTRFFSSGDDSHSDFAPKKKSVPTPEEALKLIEKHVKENKIMLYMKGNPSQPMCGFSARVVQILKENGADFASVNVLDYPAIREGVKSYSAWPTIPQLYVDGEFIGGCDIVTSLHESGELKELVSSKKD
eukprot:CAMPEP_0172423344 /NCGR_PEP_ID=MMETSP1064-20121228/15422_1 /TAXON_ID=202472 /ORGANISM="Aulacoseira subarctica , Strain CCAP 1002/5" /LENGTH=169 /DNA_ID=CAMNT_0013164665 /DNA_START=41 /DNA_END=550 /DNA_ORIENTATION=-